MNNKYIDFIELNGISLVSLVPGSEDYALCVEDAFKALNLLEKSNIPVLGGDILTLDSSDKLIYAIQQWESEYHYLNWYCDRGKNEPYDKYCV